MRTRAPDGTAPLLVAVLALCGLPAASRAAPAPQPPAPPPGTRAAPQTQPATAPASRPAGGPAVGRTGRNAHERAAELRELEAALAADRRAAAAKDEHPQRPAGVAARISQGLQALNPAISFVADVAAAYFSAEDPLVSGAHDPSRTGFTLQQLELSVGAAVDPYFRFDAALVFSEFGVEIEEVYGTTLALPFNLQVRAGQFLTRFGRFNPTHPHSWHFADQVLVIGKFFGGENNRGLGAELSVLLPLPWYVELVGSATDAAGAATARSFFGDEDLGVDALDDLQYTTALKQFFPLAANWSLAWGLSAAFGPNASGRDNHSAIYGTDLLLKYRPITRASDTVVALEAEWLLRRRQIPLDVLQDHGLYAQLFWRFARRWGTAARYEYVSGLEDDPLDPQWSSLRQRISAALTFWPTEFSRLRLQYEYDLPGWRDGYHGIFATIELVAGAHAAHVF